MFFTLFLMLNNNFLGEIQSVQAVGEKIVQLQPQSCSKIEYDENDDALFKKLAEDLSKPGEKILITSGNSPAHQHGVALIKSEKMQAFVNVDKLKSKFASVIWLGHQDPGIIEIEKLIDIVGLPRHIVRANPNLQAVFQERLVVMDSVPNTLKIAGLQQELQTFNQSNPNNTIPKSDEGYIGVFLGGDAPKPDNTMLYWTEKNAYELGQKLGMLAQKENKKLLVTNGPRTGKFYPDSPDPKAPVIRQFNHEGWLPLASIPEAQRIKPDSKLVVHAADAPLDPVSLAFIQGVESSGLKKSQFWFSDFKPGKSAYTAVIAALYEMKEKSFALYSGESISYAEIGYAIPNTYAFPVDSMNEQHRDALNHFCQDLHMVGQIDFNRTFNEQLLDMKKKQISTQQGAEGDAKKIAERFWQIQLKKQKELKLSAQLEDNYNSLGSLSDKQKPKEAIPPIPTYLTAFSAATARAATQDPVPAKVSKPDL